MKKMYGLMLVVGLISAVSLQAGIKFVNTLDKDATVRFYFTISKAQSFKIPARRNVDLGTDNKLSMAEFKEAKAIVDGKTGNKMPTGKGNKPYGEYYIEMGEDNKPKLVPHIR